MRLTKLLPIMVALISPQLALSQPSQETTIREPAVIKLADVFGMSDRVALVKVVSGDTENYSKAVYKARVLSAYKGTSEGETVYFGPYEGVRLGSEYILFLRSSPKPLEPKPASRVNYGTVKYSEVFEEGYSEMRS